MSKVACGGGGGWMCLDGQMPLGTRQCPEETNKQKRIKETRQCQDTKAPAGQSEDWGVGMAFLFNRLPDVSNDSTILIQSNGARSG